MNFGAVGDRRWLPSDLLLLAVIFAIPIMKPAVSVEVIAADLLFVVLVLVLGMEVLAGARRVPSIAGYEPLLLYVAALACSLVASSNRGATLFKLATEFYLVGLAGVSAWLIDSEAKFRRAVLAWLAATALVCLIGLFSLAAFATGRAAWLLDYSNFGFGSLPPGDYPRLALTFFNANMACNYLTVGLALTFVSRALRYIGPITYRLLLGGIGMASLSTVSPGLGGIALLAGLWTWARHGHGSAIGKIALLGGSVVAGLFVVALALTPFPHSTAPFLMRLPRGLNLYPGPRLLIWIAALEQFVAHPLLGIGLGIDPVHVGFDSPSGFEVLTDAHNIFLSIGAQCGLVGLIGLGAIIQLANARTPSPQAPGAGSLVKFTLGAAFLDVFVYQGLGGSFEDTRHIWVLLGLLIAASRIDFSPVGGNSRKAGEPSSC
jgi:putative inorganic carbon (hco3(-)) transporter